MTAQAVPRSTPKSGTMITIEAILVSKASIFLPRYSGVRPTMSPPMKTTMMAKTSMP